VSAQSTLPLDAEQSAQSGRPASQTGPGTGDTPSRAKLEPLSASTYRVQFTASAELHAKIQYAKDLLSHSVPSGDLPALFEKALDALIDNEIRRRWGAGKQRKRRTQKPDSRHVPLAVALEAWKRDASQCAANARS
jgi:hypothetical protein